MTSLPSTSPCPVRSPSPSSRDHPVVVIRCGQTASPALLYRQPTAWRPGRHAHGSHCRSARHPGRTDRRQKPQPPEILDLTQRGMRSDQPDLHGRRSARPLLQNRPERRVGARLSGRWLTAQQSRFDPIDSRPGCIFVHRHIWGKCLRTGSSIAGTARTLATPRGSAMHRELRQPRTRAEGEARHGEQPEPLRARASTRLIWTG